jgi:hypothetical protein
VEISTERKRIYTGAVFQSFRELHLEITGHADDTYMNTHNLCCMIHKFEVLEPKCSTEKLATT